MLGSEIYTEYKAAFRRKIRAAMDSFKKITKIIKDLLKLNKLKEKKLDEESIYRIDAELRINGNRLGLRWLWNNNIICNCGPCKKGLE